MQTMKQILINKIDNMPDDMTKRVLDFVEELEYEDDKITGPESLRIKSEEDFINKVQAGIDDIEAGRYHSLDETLAFLHSL